MAPALPVVQITARKIFGRTEWHPANDPARLLARISGRTCLTDDILRDLRKLGMVVEEVPYAPAILEANKRRGFVVPRV